MKHSKCSSKVLYARKDARKDARNKLIEKVGKNKAVFLCYICIMCWLTGWKVYFWRNDEHSVIWGILWNILMDWFLFLLLLTRKMTRKMTRKNLLFTIKALQLKCTGKKITLNYPNYWDSSILYIWNCLFELDSWKLTMSTMWLIWLVF